MNLAFKRFTSSHKPLKFYQEVNQERVYQSENVQVYDKPASSSDPEQPKTYCNVI